MKSAGVHTGRIRLPIIESVLLRSFTLYDNMPSIEVGLGDGVFCLAGANGLGKSTFISAINFGLTGIVASPSREFKGVSDYYRNSLPYSQAYFRGRISEEDGETAEIELRIKCGQHRYRITRGAFEPLALRSLKVFDVGGNAIAAHADSDSDEARHQRFAAMITDDCGLDEFAQLVFLQHFVLTFDERRHLIFWDERVAQNALFMVFGLSLDKARQADTLRRTAERADSLARNYQWQATRLRQEARAIERVGDDEDASVSGEYSRLLGEVTELQAHAERARNARSDAELRCQGTDAQLRQATVEYQEAADGYLHSTVDPLGHPLVADALTEQRCAICGTTGEATAKAIRTRAADHHCPLCGTRLQGEDDSDETRRREFLADLDAALAGALANADDAAHAAKRLGEEVEGLERDLAVALNNLISYEREHELAAVSRPDISVALAEKARQIRSQVASILNDKRLQVDRRDQARRDLVVLQKDLAAAYAEAEADFVPRFTTLARAFLGLDLELDLDIRDSGVQLILTVQSSRRRYAETLSESQRFFLEIALRMALAQQMSEDGSPACLYIDTPEGALDIAYESRAGAMFGRFVIDGDHLVMTANINTSQLLIRLAETCGHSRMTLHRMTQWASLSEVQAAEEHLFEQAYDRIEGALGQK